MSAVCSPPIITTNEKLKKKVISKQILCLLIPLESTRNAAFVFQIL